jgi:hypothetical protein
MVTQIKLDAAKILADVADDKRFFCQDGCVIKNLTELVDCLDHMTEEVFYHHVTSDKNDFSNWIRDVLGDEKLAGELSYICTPQEATEIVKKRVVSFQINRNQHRRLKKRR